jgi:hypothetical protein
MNGATLIIAAIIQGLYVPAGERGRSGLILPVTAAAGW